MLDRFRNRELEKLSDIHNIKSAEELANRVLEIRDRFRITEFENKCRDIQKAFVPGSMHDRVKQGTITADDILSAGRDNLSPKLWYNLYSARIAELGSEYSIEQYEVICNKLIENFYERRRQFMINSVITDPGFIYPKSFAYGTGVSEEIVATIVRENVKKAEEADQNIRILYEDLDGSLKTAQVITGDSPDTVVMDKDMISAKPRSHWQGTCYFDSFRIDYYYDTEKKNWVGIPVSLIYRLEMEYPMMSEAFGDYDDFD